MLDWLRRSLWDGGAARPARHTERAAPTPGRHRRGRPRRRRGVLGWSLRIEPGSATFYVATDACWPWCGRSARSLSGRLHLGRITAGRGARCGRSSRRSCSGCCWPALFVVGRPGRARDRAARPTGPLGARLRRRGLGAAAVVITLVNGIAEELFFRGAAYAAIPRHPVAWTTLAYFVATLATGNVMLAFAAILLGARVRPAAPRERRRARADPHARAPGRSSMLFALPAVLPLTSSRTRRLPLGPSARRTDSS